MGQVAMAQHKIPWAYQQLCLNLDAEAEADVQRSGLKPDNSHTCLSTKYAVYQSYIAKRDSDCSLNQHQTKQV